MDVYLKNPPQIYSNNNFKYAPTFIPPVNHNSYKIHYIRLIPENVNLQEHLKRKYIFPLQTVENIEQEIEQTGIVV